MVIRALLLLSLLLCVLSGCAGWYQYTIRTSNVAQPTGWNQLKPELVEANIWEAVRPLGFERKEGLSGDTYVYFIKSVEKDGHRVEHIVIWVSKGQPYIRMIDAMSPEKTSKFEEIKMAIEEKLFTNLRIVPVFTQDRNGGLSLN